MSTNRLQFLRKMGLDTKKSYSLEELAKVSKFPLQALKEVEAKGRGAYSSNPQSVRVKGTFAKNPSLAAVPLKSRLSIDQWSLARVYAFLNRSPKVFGKADADIAIKYKLK
jgi:hypothetical protein